MDENNVKPGEMTSEYRAARSGSAWGIVSAVLGVIMSAGSAVLQAVGADTKAGILAGAALAIVGVISKTLVDLGYIKSRTDVKVAARSGTEAPPGF
jgi:hypothetical protein